MTTDHLEQNATENAGVSKMQGWKSRHENAGVEYILWLCVLLPYSVIRDYSIYVCINNSVRSTSYVER